jgi:hypothetical protein
MAPLPLMKCYRTLPLICAIWFICAGPCLAQETIKPPSVGTFRPLLEWLASPALVGRETGTHGEALAANYIASEMLQSGLRLWKKSSNTDKGQLSDYFQSFSVLRLKPENGSLSIPSNHK